MRRFLQVKPGRSIDMERWMDELVGDLREGRVADVAGTRAALDLSLSEALLNRIVAARLPPDGPVRDLRLRVVTGEVLVTVRLERPRFLPPMTIKARIERQPDLPARPDLALRLGLPAGLGVIAGIGASLFASLPPGLRMDGDRVTVDLARLLADQGQAWLLRYARALLITFEPGRVRIQGSAAIE